MPVHFRPEAAAGCAEENKDRKHFDVCNVAGFFFTAFAVDIFGVLAPDAAAFFYRIARLLETSQGIPSYLPSK